MRSFQPRSIFTKAARFIYLNRTCWNGLYRVNRRGDFNVPMGSRSKVVFDDDAFDKISKILKGADLVVSDFEDLINESDKGDFVFVDPPYTVRHNNNAFIKYNEKLFSWKDQERLCESLIRAKKRGVIIVGTNAYHRCVRNLYESTFKTFSVDRNSCISSKVKARKICEELVIFTEAKHG
jgi:DNA adenine methylase